MSKELSFNQLKGKYFKTLAQYIPIVERVHGGNHPEFHKVRNLFDTIIERTKEAESARPDLNEEFAKLREITDNYRVPSDVCESYEAVYNMLSESDEAYRA